MVLFKCVLSMLEMFSHKDCIDFVLHSHGSMIHSVEKPYQCKTCDKRFLSFFSCSEKLCKAHSTPTKPTPSEPSSNHHNLYYVIGAFVALVFVILVAFGCCGIKKYVYYLIIFFAMTISHRFCSLIIG